jgi:hypothetical protein
VRQLNERGASAPHARTRLIPDWIAMIPRDLRHREDRCIYASPIRSAPRPGSGFNLEKLDPAIVPPTGVAL